MNNIPFLSFSLIYLILSAFLGFIRNDTDDKVIKKLCDILFFSYIASFVGISYLLLKL